jgi:plasmid stabilization system protein ParE
MKPYTLRYLRLALDDLSEIQEFNRRFSEKYQNETIAALKARCGSLAENPFGAPRYEYDTRYRKAAVGDYLIFYQVDEKKCLVSICRILHGARNIVKILSRNKLRK